MESAPGEVLASLTNNKQQSRNGSRAPEERPGRARRSVLHSVFCGCLPVAFWVPIRRPWHVCSRSGGGLKLPSHRPWPPQHPHAWHCTVLTGHEQKGTALAKEWVGELTLRGGRTIGGARKRVTVEAPVRQGTARGFGGRTHETWTAGLRSGKSRHVRYFSFALCHARPHCRAPLCLSPKPTAVPQFLIRTATRWPPFVLCHRVS